MKNKKIIIIVASIILVAIIGLITFLYVNLKNSEKYINEVNILLESNEYEEAYKIISDKKLLLKTNEKTNKLIQTNLIKYKITNINALMDLSENDWENIENFNILVSNLNLDNENINYKYLKELLKIREDYNIYFNSIRWINSAEYEQYKMYSELKSSDESDIIITANLLSNYSFEKYDLNSPYIKELNEETKKLSSAYNSILTALKRMNSNLLEESKNMANESLSTIADIQINILLKSNEIEKLIKNLPNI